ncbi:polysaccharide deacetylase family protein [Rummeliibacillus suwonensis]|uniref:polysaccharide deacetylase family protein n=1 Tax=Rummeliibacillus suwonensis TaxID=1306154 RepID=UPI0011B43E87|nr:polysaccharide deacetylase family protein [Rummeliibacillus suwonensis]
MKRNNIIILTVCVLVISICYATFSYAADKGRKYYEQTGQVLWDVQTKEKVIALTFDDGPDPRYTSQILEVLAKYDAKATFFMLGKSAEKYPEIVKRQFNEGHELANHTYSHPFKIGGSKLKEELKKTNDIIYNITGYAPTLFRPVGGIYTDDIINTAKKSGYKVVIWSWHLDTQDWKSPGVRKISKKVLDGASPGDVVLFHDGGGNRTQTIKALEQILPVLKKRGYKFVTVSELMAAKNQEISK